MTNRNPWGVLLLPMVTFGIYGIVWLVKTKEELKAKGSDIPSAWLLIVPLVNLLWIWKYSKGVEKVTGGSTTAGASFCLLCFLGCIGMAVIQSRFNKVTA